MHKLTCLAVTGILTIAGASAQTDEVEKYLEFMNANLSLPDSLNRPADFYRRNIASSLQARREMPWGQSVPEREWRYFVLPVRVNNEALDTSRMAFYRELAPRVHNLSMADAALEVNHWCHEHVTYRPSDGRTLSPLACANTAWGRCGEESTFAVAALRSVGIPARQVYTPRWAHTDDNHAWVEVWVDGRWHYMGACEPSAALDDAWFNSSAPRAMMMATNVQGHYDGPEEVLQQRPLSTRINVTANYAPVDTARVIVSRTDGTPAAGAKVDFMLYNYAEFYPLATRTAKADGSASLAAGLGDILVWATDVKRFGLGKVSVGKSDEPVKIILDKDAGFTGTLDFDLVPPTAKNALGAQIEAGQIAANQCRLAYEDSLRGLKMAKFATHDMGVLLAEELGADTDTIYRILQNAHGNHDVIAEFLRSTDATTRAKAIKLLNLLTPKDLSDVTRVVLDDHLANSVSDAPYVLNPRVGTEELTPYRAILVKELAAEGIDDAPSLQKWIAENIEIDTAYAKNPLHLTIDPVQVYQHRRDIDKASRDAFYVAAARSLGIASRIDPISGHLQIDGAGAWRDVQFERTADTPAGAKGLLQLVCDVDSFASAPVYNHQFSVAKISDGRPSTLGFDEARYDEIFAEPQAVDAGQYMLVTGQRLADGAVLARCEFFAVDTTLSIVPISVRHDVRAIEVIGNFDSENKYSDAEGHEKSLLATNGRGYFVLGLLKPNHEPSVHALNDLTAAAGDLEHFAGKIFVLYDDAEALDRANIGNFKGLPANVVTGVDVNGQIGRQLGEASIEYPVFVIADTFNRVVFRNQGYTIGLGEKLADTLRRLK